MKSDFFGDHILALADVAYDALEKDDVEILQGLQAHAISLWTWTITGSALLSYLIRRTVEERIKKKEQRKKWELEKYPVSKEEKEELYNDKIWLKFSDLRDATTNISTVVIFIKGWEARKFIDVIDKNPEGYEEDPRGVYISLASIWNKVLSRLERNKKETQAFSEATGKLLTLPILKDAGYSFAGVRTYKPMALLASRVKDDETPITIDAVKDIFDECGLPIGKFYQMESYDNQRDPSIRFIKKNTGKEIYLQRHVIRARKLIHQRALEIARKRRLSRR